MEKYDHKKIEEKWIKSWKKTKLYRTSEDKAKPKYYILDMFPYPSGSGLHVGHPKGYIATDIFARAKMMQGYNVLHPMGWDAFGLPAENYAIANKIHPRAATEKNIATFKNQLGKLGFTYDWEREINTTDPEYYKWTQWTFIKMFERGLAYESNEPVNWCPSCKTVLSNEDLEGGLCERCGTAVERKPMRQWVLKITDYADRLLNDLEKLPDWEESIKEMQRNWIGRSEGAIVKFSIFNFQFSNKSKKSNCQKFIEVFTTRPDTLFGATFMVISPEHKLIQDLKSEIKNWAEVEGYINAAKNKSDLERTDLNKEKTGIKLEGIMAINPVNNEEIPIFVADYVLTGYGTGAIMAVPAHDQRDFEFAIKYNLPIKQVVRPEDILKSIIVTETVEKGLKDELVKSKIEFTIGLSRNGREHIRIVLKEYQINKFIKMVQSYLKGDGWVDIIGARNILVFKDKVFENFQFNDLKLFERLKRTEPLVRKYNSIWEMLWHNSFYEEFVCYIGEGVVINSGDFTGMKSNQARSKMAKEFGKLTVHYKLRDWVFSRQRYWGEPIPIIHCEKCGNVAVPEKELPLKLPEVKNYQPTGTGESPLANIKEWVNTKCPKCGGKALRETNTMPQWAGSSWYYLRYIDPKNKKALVDKVKEKYWSPVDFYVGGAEHATRHLIYARFWHKFLYDIGAVNYDEPFTRLQQVGLIMAEDGRKMSKRWGNVINPDEIVEKFGADSLRVYEMFMGPFNQPCAWSTNGVIGARRFLENVYKLKDKKLYDCQGGDCKIKESGLPKLLHKTIKKVTQDIEDFHYNTAISAMMIFVNFAGKLDAMPRGALENFLKILAPFAPHLCEELWSELGNKESIFKQPWPKYNPELVKDETINLVIQINGKVRDTLKVLAEISEEEAKKIALESEKIKKWLEYKEIIKVIFVKGKLVNIVI
ncbi:MAG: leucine--tRNA ligase [bacterium]|nr:leucine--tRNA ligase [bacterium]